MLGSEEGAAAQVPGRERLAKRLDQGSMSVREALRIAIEVGKGLAHAHERGVVHRDLTPGNIFLCQDGQVKVLDLGLAHAFGRPGLNSGAVILWSDVADWRPRGGSDPGCRRRRPTPSPPRGSSTIARLPPW